MSKVDIAQAMGSQRTDPTPAGH